MITPRTAAEYRGASIRLWGLAVGATQSASHDAFADLAIIYETLANQAQVAENAAAPVPKAAVLTATARNVLPFVPRRAPL